MTKMSESRYYRREGKRLGIDFDAEKAAMLKIEELARLKLLEVNADMDDLIEIQESWCEVCDSCVSLIYCDKGSFRLDDNGHECCQRVYDGMVRDEFGEVNFSFP